MYFLNFLYNNLFLEGVFLLVFNSEMDTASLWQYNFFDPATPIMEGIINFENDLMFFIVVIIIFGAFFSVLGTMMFFYINLLFRFLKKKKFDRFYFSNSILEILENFYNQDQKIFVTSTVAITLSILLASSIWWINRPSGRPSAGNDHKPNDGNDHKPSEWGDYDYMEDPMIPIRGRVRDEELQLSAQALEAIRLRSIASLEEKAADEAAEIALEEAALRQALVVAQPAVGDGVVAQPAALPSGSDGGSDPSSRPNFFFRIIYYIIELLF